MDATSPTLWVRLLVKFVPTLIGWLYSEDRIKGEIDIWTRATGACLTCSYSSQEGTCWLVAANRSPFEIKLQKLRVKFVGDGLNGTIEKFSPEIISSAKNKEICLQGSVPILEQNYKFAQKSISERRYPKIEIKAVIVCGKKEFSWEKTHNDVQNVEILN
jgi:hypothetical protein